MEKESDYIEKDNEQGEKKKDRYVQDPLFGGKSPDEEEIIVIPEDKPEKTREPRRFKENQGAQERLYYDSEGKTIEKEKICYFKKNTLAIAQGMEGFLQSNIVAAELDEKAERGKNYMFLANLDKSKTYVSLWKNNFGVYINDEKPVFRSVIKPYKTRKKLEL